MISAIVAVDKNWGIGYNGELLEHIPEDLQQFKQKTLGKVVIMGRKTQESLPRKFLPGRQNVVLTHMTQESYTKDGILFCNMEYLLRQASYILQKLNPEDEWFIIGGGSIYEQLLPLCDRVYVTLIEKSHDNVDTYFPNLDKDPQWEVSTCTELRDYKDIPYAFLTYDRIS